MKNHADRLPRFLGLMVAGLILFAAALPSGAASYPAKPIEMIIGAGPGSASDVIGRALAHSARKFIDQPIVVINKTGGGGVVGTEYVIGSKPDGYTILFGFGSGEHIMAPHMQKLPHNPVASLKTVILVTETPIVLAVKGDSPFKKVKDLIDFAKQNPGKASFGATPGGVTQIVPEVLAMKGGAKFVLIPTTGSGATLTQVMGGHITMGSLTPSVAVGPVKSGRVRALAVSSEKRNRVLPDVPTFKEEGFDIVMAAIKGIAVPQNTPEEIVQALHDGFKKCLSDPEFVSFMEKTGEPITYRDSKDYGAYLQNMYKFSGEVIESLGLKAK